MRQRPDLNSLQELLLCCGNIYLWKYDASGELLHSNCPDEAVLNKAFELFGCKGRVVSYGADHHRPISLRAEAGLVWFAAFEWEDTLRYIHVIGPVFYSDDSRFAAESSIRAIRKEQKVSLEWTMHLLHVMEQLPVMQCTIMMYFVLMAHNCITGEKLQISDIDAEVDIPAHQILQKPVTHDRYRVWSIEQALLQTVRNGDLDYKQALSDSMNASTGVGVSGITALVRSKISVIVFASIVCRAAIEGGLSPEEAYGLGDSYIQSVESIDSPSDLAPLAISMYDDFVHRVHRQRTNPHYSQEIQKCCDYIEMHLGERITAKTLAERIGYAEYYLTKKFRAETGISVRQFLKCARMEKAKLFLASTDNPIEEIAEQLGFGSRSFFSREFKKITGYSPAQYRNLQDIESK